jgi:hypothetical protein
MPCSVIDLCSVYLLCLGRRLTPSCNCLPRLTGPSGVSASVCGSDGRRCACNVHGSALNAGWRYFPEWQGTRTSHTKLANTATVDVVPPAKGRRLFFSYGFYVNSSGGFAAEPTLELIVPGAENVMVVSNPTSQEKARTWGEHGGTYALHLPRDNRSYSLTAYLGQGNTTEGIQLAASHFEQWLQPRPFNETWSQPFE